MLATGLIREELVHAEEVSMAEAGRISTYLYARAVVERKTENLVILDFGRKGNISS